MRGGHLEHSHRVRGGEDGPQRQAVLQHYNAASVDLTVVLMNTTTV